MNDKIQHILALVVLTLSCHAGMAKSAIEKYGRPIEELPSVITFDCTVEPDKNSVSIVTLGTSMRVPKMFEVREGDETWLSWNVLLRNDAGETFETRFVWISFGEYDAKSMSNFLSEFQTISGPDANKLNATIIQRVPQPEDLSGQYWVLLLKGGMFLKIVSYDQVDWTSLLTCFD